MSKPDNKYLLAIALTTSILTACQPYVFGIPQNEFNLLTSQQKAAVINGYNQKQLELAKHGVTASDVRVYGPASSSSSSASKPQS